jgi:hypothetical protein
MDRSASIRVAPEPCRSGDIEIPSESQGNSGEFLTKTLSVSLDAFKFEGLRRTSTPRSNCPQIEHIARYPEH